MRVLLVALALLVPLAIQAQRTATPPQRPAAPFVARTPQSVPFKVGEHLTFNVSWSGVFSAGHASMTVVGTRPAGGSTVWEVSAEGRTNALLYAVYPLEYKADSLIDTYDLLASKGTLWSREGRRDQMKVTTFDRRAGKAFFDVDGDPARKEIPLAAGATDALSAMYALRARPFRRGDRFTLPVLLNGNVLTIQITVEAREQINTAIGSVMAWRLVPLVLNRSDTTPHNMAAWVTDDARKLPVKMQVALPMGTFDLTLTAVQ